MPKKKKRKPSVTTPVSPKIPTKPRSLPLKHLFAIGLMVAVALAAYANSFNVPFLFDDAGIITENPHVQVKSISFERLIELFKDLFTNYHRIFAYLTFAFNYYFVGYNVFGYHLVNLFIHIASGIFLYWFLILTLNLPSLRERYGSIAFSTALFSSLLFLSHPIQTQSVTYIVQRMNSMAGMFYLLAMLLYIKGRLTLGKKGGFYFTGAGVSYLFAIFSKENAAILPLFILLYEFYFFQNLDLNLKRKKKFTYMIGTVLLAGALIFFFFFAKRFWHVLTSPGYKVQGFTLIEGILTQFRVVLYYVTLLLYPHPSRLNLDYDFPISKGILDPPTTLISILIVLGLIGYSLWVAKKKPLISFFILWYFGNLLIESSILPLEIVYEHRLYLPSIGPIVLFIILMEKGWKKVKEVKGEREKGKGEIEEAEGSLKKNLPLWIVFILITFLFCLGAYQRNTIWKDVITLWEDCVKKSPNKSRPNYNLGLGYAHARRYQEAIDYFKKAIRLKPDDVASYYNLGATYREMQLFDQAAYYFERYLRFAPSDPEGYNEIGLIYLKKNKMDEAILYFKKGLGINPKAATIHANLGDVYLQTGKLDEAISEYKKALSLNFHPTTLYFNLAVAYQKKGMVNEAIDELQMAIRLDPNQAEAHNNLGVIFLQRKRLEEAISSFEKALTINPRYGDAYSNLMVAYYYKKDLSSASLAAKRALELGVEVDPRLLKELRIRP